MCLYFLGPSSSPTDALPTEMAEMQGTKANCASALQAFGHVMPHNVLLV